jgi:hypothetical protein
METVDCSCGAVVVRWQRLGILSLARLGPSRRCMRDHVVDRNSLRRFYEGSKYGDRFPNPLSGSELNQPT